MQALKHYEWSKRDRIKAQNKLDTKLRRIEEIGISMHELTIPIFLDDFVVDTITALRDAKAESDWEAHYADEAIMLIKVASEALRNSGLVEEYGGC